MKDNRRNQIQRIGLFLFGMICGMLFLSKVHTVTAAEKQYGLLVAKKDGTYTFYDLNQEAGSQNIELSENAKIMIPLRKVCSYFSDLSYQYDFSTGKATVTNTSNGKKLVLQENQKYAYLYKKGAATGTKVKLLEKSYISTDSKALMVHMTALQSIFAKKTGYHYYEQDEMIAAGYDYELYHGMIVYNQYKKVSSLPKAVKVQYGTEKIASNVVKITIPEGYSVAQVVNRLVKNGICISSQALYQAMEQVDYSQYPMFDGRNVDETICFPLEGYLYPDTYEFYKNTAPEQVISKMLKNSETKLEPYAKEANEQGYTLGDLLKIASIIEKETGSKSEMPKVASVLRARLAKKMKLQCDATIYYVEKYLKPYISGDINRYNAYYNTYKCKALPSGAICSPGKNALKAALHPCEEVYLYFATDDAGNYYYAANDEEWKAMSQEISEKNAEYQKEKSGTESEDGTKKDTQTEEPQATFG